MSEEARMKARRAQQVEILKLQEERLDEHMANLYSEQQVGQLRSYREILRGAGRVTTLHDNTRVNFDNRWISRHGATRILTDGVQEQFAQRTDCAERLASAKDILYAEPLRLPIKFVGLETVTKTKHAWLYNNNVTSDISKNDGLDGFDPLDKYVNFGEFYDWCSNSGQPLPHWYRQLSFPELPNWPLWEHKTRFTSHQASHLLLNIEPGSIAGSSNSHDDREGTKVEQEQQNLQDLLDAAIADGTVESADSRYVSMPNATIFAETLCYEIPARLKLSDDCEDKTEGSDSDLNSDEVASITITDKIVQFRFNGKEFPIKHSKGVKHLIHLLSHPNEKFEPETLMQNVNPSYLPLVGKDKIDGEVPVRNSIQEALPVSDKVAIKNIQTEIKDKREQLDFPIDLEKKEEIEEEIEKLETGLGKLLDVQGKIRKEKSDRKRAIDAVNKTIERSLGEIDKLCPELHRHLESEIILDKGQFYIYRPQPTVMWVVR